MLFTTPLDVRDTINRYGNTYAYWELREMNSIPPFKALWLIFVANQIKTLA